MYSNKFVAAVKVAGQVLRERETATGTEVALPFGSEYSVLLKNVDPTLRAQVNVFIDGTDVAEGTAFIVGPGQSVDLERFIRNGNLAAGNRFKFIERTAAVEAHRGVTEEDGLIRVQFTFEKPQPIVTIYPVRREYVYVDPWWNTGPIYPRRYWDHQIICNTMSSGSHTTAGPSGSIVRSAAMRCSASDLRSQTMDYAPQEEVERNGITAPGSKSTQAFQSVGGFDLQDVTHGLVIKLVGRTYAGFEFRTPVTVKAKPSCGMCGKTNDADAKFCKECGASVEIF